MNHFFYETIQPLMQWLHTHAYIALGVTFLIALFESLIIIGTLIPGSFSMTALGILAGSGIMRIDLTMFCAIAGAFIGDSLSYLIGFLCSDKIAGWWPFSRHPKWLNYGKNYFQTHGGKSIIIGRFFGPLRSMIPVIAGMMHMEKMHFIIANFISALIWSITYVVPGIIIGAVSSELSPEQATRFFLLILASLISIWLLSMLIKALWIRWHKIWDKISLTIWNYGLQFSPTRAILSPLHSNNPAKNIQSFHLISIILLTICVGVFCLIAPKHILLINQLNQNIYLFIQSLRTTDIDKLAVYIRLLITPLSLGLIWLTIFIYTLSIKNYRLTIVWSILLCANLTLYWFFPIINPLILCLTTALFFLHSLSPIISYLLPLLILCFDASTLILGQIDFFNLLATTAFSCAIAAFFIIVSKRNPFSLSKPILWACVFLPIMTSGTYNNFTQFNTYLEDNTPQQLVHTIPADQWWNTTNSQLPLHITNHLGRPIGILNIQYTGPLTPLIQQLEKNHWKKQPHSWVYRALMRSSHKSASVEFPLLNPLYQQKKPIITLTLLQQSPKNHPSRTMYILRFWESGYYLTPSHQPIYLGSIQHNANSPLLTNPLTFLTQQLSPNFQIQQQNQLNTKHSWQYIKIQLK